jgi:membrane-associated phospholipid phosphatase
MVNLIRKNWPFFLPLFLFLIVGAILQLKYSQAQIFLYINSTYSTSGDYFFQYFTHAGDGLFYAAVILLLLFVRYGYALMALVAFLLSSGVAQLLKRLLFAGSPRPKAFFEKSSATLHWVEGVSVHMHNSFPSGHATTTFSLFCLLSLLAVKRGWGWLWFALALLAAYSRVYLGQHFFGDIFAGAVIGTSASVACYLLMNRWYGKTPGGWHTRNLLQRQTSGSEVVRGT